MTACETNIETSFAELCEASGGRISNDDANSCICRDSTCDPGILCQKNHTCANASCKEGETKCEGKKVFLCDEGNWNEVTTCTMTCDEDNKLCNECKPDDVKCKNNTISICQYGTWKIDSSCDDGLTCNKSGTGCADCVDGKTK